MCLPNSAPMFGMGLQNVFTQQCSNVRYEVTKCVYPTVLQCSVWGYKMCLPNSAPMSGMGLQNVFTQQWSGMGLQNVFTQQWSDVRYGVTKCVYPTVVQCSVWGYKMCLPNSAPMFGMGLQNVFTQQ